MNNKKFLIAALSLILLFLVRCGDKPTDSGSEKKLSHYAGVWEGGGQKITINSDGSFNIDGRNIPASDITKNGNTFSFDIDGVKHSLTFKSDTEVEFKKGETQIPITKNPDKLISSIPEAKGEPATDLENATYKGKIPIDINNSDATDSYFKINRISREQLIKEMETATIELSLTIAENKITLIEIETSGEQWERLKSVQPLKEGKKYSYKLSDKNVSPFEGGKKLNMEYITYIEFTKSGNDITFTYTTAFSYEGDMPSGEDESGKPTGYIYVSDYGYKETYTGKLIKN